MGADHVSLAVAPWYTEKRWPSGDDLRGLANILPRFPRPTVSVRIDRQADEPAWLPAVLNRMRTLSGLAPDWDGAGAKAPTEAALTAGLRLLPKVLSREAATPAVVPTPEGGVQFEWHDAGWDVEIEIDSSGLADAWGENVASGASFFGDLNSDDLHLAIKEITVHQASRSA